MAKKQGSRKTVTKTLYLPEKLREYKIKFANNRELLNLRKAAGYCKVLYNKKNEPVGCESVSCIGTCSGPNLVVFFDSDGKPITYYVCICSSVTKLL